LSLALLPFPTTLIYLVFGLKLFDDYAAGQTHSGRVLRRVRNAKIPILDENATDEWPVLANVAQIPFLTGNDAELLIDGDPGGVSVGPPPKTKVGGAEVFFEMLPSRNVGLGGKAGVQAGALSHGEKQWLEIGMVMAQDPELLLVDEPVAGLTEEETARTGELLLSIAAERSVLVIEHDMEFVRQIARTVTVLHQGATLCEGPVEQVQNDPRVLEVYLGQRKDTHAVR